MPCRARIMELLNTVPNLLEEESAANQAEKSVCSLPATDRLLVTLNRYELRKFFPDATLLESIFPETRSIEACCVKEDQWHAALRSYQPTAILSCWSTPRIPEDIAGNPDSPLKYICHVTGSPKNLVPRSFFERGGIVTNWGNLAAGQVAEQALLLALSALRNQGAWRSQTEEFSSTPFWDMVETLQTRTLFGRRVGVHGFGQIAQSLVRLLRPFNVQVFAYSQGVPPEIMRQADVVPCDSLAALFSQSEVLFECEALTPSTFQCVDESLLSCLPDDAVFVNIARGHLANEAALQRELQSGRIRVALDVVATEPLTPEHPFWTYTNAIMSPHIGAPTADMTHAYGDFAAENLRCFRNRMPLQGVVSLSAYDRCT